MGSLMNRTANCKPLVAPRPQTTGVVWATRLQAEGDLADNLHSARINMQGALSRLHASIHRVGQEMVACPAFALAA